jgi:hypothetical protein
METREIFVGNKKEIRISCLECGRERLLDLENLINTRKRIRVNCVCGATFKAIFERRMFYRKMASLLGYYSNLDSNDPPDQMTVVNLSRGGLGFRTIGSARLKEGDPLRVEFNLDTEHQTRIIKNVTVRYVSDNYVGAAFSKLDESTQKSLGFYLLP